MAKAKEQAQASADNRPPATFTLKNTAPKDPASPIITIGQTGKGANDGGKNGLYKVKPQEETTLAADGTTYTFGTEYPAPAVDTQEEADQAAA